METHTSISVTGASRPDVWRAGDNAFLHISDGDGNTAMLHGPATDFVAFFHKVIAEMASVEEELCAEKLVREQLGLELEPTT